MNRPCSFDCAPCVVGARCACPIPGAKHRAPTIETIVSATFSRAPTFMLKIVDIHTYYGDSYVLQGISLEVRQRVCCGPSRA